MLFGNNMTSDPKIIVDYFGQFFKSIYNSSTTSSIDKQYINSLPSVFECSNMCFDLNDVKDALVKLKPKKTADILGFFPIVFRYCASSLSIPLLQLFNESVSIGVFLDEWKVSIIDPIFKSGSKNLVTNYRPITKLSVVPKLLDRLVQNKFNSIIKQHVSKYQHGFWKGRSTNTNLVEFTNFCINTLDNRRQVHVIYTDFVKAFSRVNLNILLKKLQAYGLHGSLLRWFSSYLFGRKQFVKIGDFLSNEIKVTSGVPEGSHLGPSLFLIFINDLPNVLKNSHCLMYADDIKFFSRISNLNDCLLFQNDLNSFVDWCQLNDLLLNVEKCACMAYNRSLLTIIPRYSLNNLPLQIVEEIKDLGVIFDSKFKFNLHINFIVSKANSLLGFIKRNSLDFKDPYTIKSFIL